MNTEQSDNHTNSNIDSKRTRILPYSYHTFLYPFYYELDKSSLHNNETDIETVLNCANDWVKDDFFNNENIESMDDVHLTKNVFGKYDFDDIWRYNKYQYFFPKARNNLFNNSEKKDSLHYLKRKCDNTDEFYGKYIIDRMPYDFNLKQYVPEHFELNINEIKLSLYPKYNIGILVIENEYYPEGLYKAEKQETKDLNTDDVDYSEDSEIDHCNLIRKKTYFENVCRINDFGRRVFAPSLNWPPDEHAQKVQNQLVSSYITADKITIEKRKEDNDKPIHKRIIHIKGKNDEVKISYTPEIELIEYLLGENVCRHLGIIKPILDDRMFTVCLVRDNNISNYANIVAPYLEEKSYCMSQVSDIAYSIYRLIFMDGVSASCQSNRMLREKLKEHLYDRWAGWGTFHGVSEYSLICATGEDEGTLNTVIYPFLIEYVDIAKLAIIQRSEIVSLEEKMIDTVKEIEGSFKSIPNEEDIKKIRDCWMEYVVFQSEVFLPEVTFQEQGVELYSMLKHCLKINELMDRLDNQMDNMKSLADMASEHFENESTERLEKKLNILAVVGFTIALFSAGQDFLAAMISGNIQSDTIIEKYILSFSLVGILSGMLSYYLNNESDVHSKRLKTPKINISHSLVWIGMWIVIALIVALTYLL